MYGISKERHSGSEARFISVLNRASNCAAAVESLAELMTQVQGKSSDQLADMSHKASVIMRAYDLNGVACEVFFSRETMASAGDTVKEFMSRTVGMIAKVSEYFYDLMTELKITAKSLRKRAIAVIGAGNSVEDPREQLVVKDKRLAASLAIDGQLPKDLNAELKKLSEMVTNLERVDFIVALDTAVKDIKRGNDHSSAQEQLHTSLEESVRDSLLVADKKALSADSGNGYMPNYTTGVAPGGVMMNVYMPSVGRSLSDYRANIVTLKSDLSTDIMPVLKAKQMDAIAKTVKAFCEQIIASSDMQTRVNAISREVRAMARDAKYKQVQQVIKPFSKMANTPSITCSRMALTVMSRAITYCENSINKIEKHSGVN